MAALFVEFDTVLARLGYVSVGGTILSMIYLFSGNNSFEIARRVAELASGFPGEVQKVDGSELVPEQLPDLLAGVTLFSSKRLIVVKQASQQKAVWAALGEWLERGIDNDLVLVETQPDKRTKTYRQLEKQATCVFVRPLQTAEAVAWLQQAADDLHLELPRTAAARLVEYVGEDQWQLSSELEKLALTGEPITPALVEKVVEPSAQATSFELLDAAFAGNQKRLGSLLRIVARQEDPYMFFGLLSGQLYAMALVQAAHKKSPETIAREAGIHPFVVRKVSVFAHQMSRRKLTQLVERLAELDANIKSRAVDPWTQVYSFLSSLAAS